MNILKVGKVIYYLLVNEKVITDKVGKQIYPLIADSDTTFPFIVYQRTSVETLTSKDRFTCKEGATVEVAIASDKYDESINIASSVIDVLNNKRGNINGVDVSGISFIGANEEYIEDTFVQKLTFKIEL